MKPGSKISGRALLIVLLAITCYSGMESAFAQDIVSTQKILVIHDSNTVGDWRREFDATLHSVLRQHSSSGQRFSLSIEYTGINRFPEGQRPEAVINSLKAQQSLEPADLVIAVLNQSAEFLQKYGDEIFPTIARIYYGSSELRPDADPSLNDDDNYYIQGNIGVPIAETLLLMPQLIPELETINVISGVGFIGSSFNRSAREQVERLSLGLEVNFIEGVPISDIKARLLGQNPANSAILFLSYTVDTNGNTVSAVEVVEDLSASLDIPIFGIFDSVLGRGLVGGFMARASNSAQQVADLAVSILRNDPAVISERINSYHFDSRQLDRFEIGRNRLPEGSVIEYDDPSAWRTYRTEILISALVMLVQAFFILALVVSHRRQRTVEKALLDQAVDLEAQKNLFESVINSIPDAIVISDVHRTIYAANAGIKHVFNFEPEEVIGLKSSELFSSLQEHCDMSEDLLLSTEDSLEPNILRYKKRNGDTFSGETISTEIISSAGETLGYFSLIRDVTQRISKEQELQQSQKMEALGNLVGGIAHDFNNVLGVISAYAEVLSFKEEQPESKTNLDKILNATQRGADLCDQIMSFSRDMSVEQSRINLVDVVKETMKLLTATIPSRINMQLECRADSYPIFANSTQMQQVILNLATNSAHAIGDDSGTLTISVQKEEIEDQMVLSQGLLPKGSYVMLRILDTGCGIKQEHFDKIFEPFFTTKKTEGTGMGMAMVYKIVRAHGGTIDLKSLIGEGTEISIYYPLLAGKATSVKQDQAAGLIKGKGEHILLVDDEIDLLESVEMMLCAIGYSVEAHSDSLEALKSFQREPARFDLVISDQTMPGITGTRLMQSMRKLRQDLPVILCTGYSDMLDKNNEYQSELSSIMRKPFTAAEMSRSIEQALAEQLPARQV